jgi:hypothetical protein
MEFGRDLKLRCVLAVHSGCTCSVPSRCALTVQVQRRYTASTLAVHRHVISLSLRLLNSFVNFTNSGPIGKKWAISQLDNAPTEPDTYASNLRSLGAGSWPAKTKQYLIRSTPDRNRSR